MGWETYEPPQESGGSGKWLIAVLTLVLFVNFLVLELSL